MRTQQEQFETIALPHLAALLRVARRLTLDPHSAEDLVQETMLLAWRGFRGFEKGTNARAWLFRILLNAFRSEGRRALIAGQVVSLEGVAPSAVQQRLEISEAIDALPLDQRTALLLCVVEGFTCREAAGILNAPIGTVMSRLSRARAELRIRLGAPEEKIRAAYQ